MTPEETTAHRLLTAWYELMIRERKRTPTVHEMDGAAAAARKLAAFEHRPRRSQNLPWGTT